MNYTPSAWRTIHRKEVCGQYNFGIRIQVAGALDRDATEADQRAIYRASDLIEEELLAETVRLDPEQAAAAQEERCRLLACFGASPIYVETIPNGYINSWYNRYRPWFIVTTRAGRIKIGWRKRVISIEWEDSAIGADAEKLFPAEDTTKLGKLIHAYGYDKAEHYICVLLLSYDGQSKKSAALTASMEPSAPAVNQTIEEARQ